MSSRHTVLVRLVSWQREERSREAEAAGWYDRYIIFQVYAYKVYHQQGFLTVDAGSGKLVIDATKTLAVLEVFCECFLRLLDFMDKADGAGLEKMLYVSLFLGRSHLISRVTQ